MEFLIENWYLIVGFLALCVVVGVAVKTFLDKPTPEQIKNIKEWLLYAVTSAEIQLGGGTGRLKLRTVYDMAIERFTWLSVIPFETFSEWVDEALVTMREMLAENEHVRAIVEEE